MCVQGHLGSIEDNRPSEDVAPPVANMETTATPKTSLPDIKLLLTEMSEYLMRILTLDPLSPHDALKHHFTSLKTDLIFLQPGVLEWRFPWNWFTNTW